MGHPCSFIPYVKYRPLFNGYRYLHSYLGYVRVLMQLPWSWVHILVQILLVDFFPWLSWHSIRPFYTIISLSNKSETSLKIQLCSGTGNQHLSQSHNNMSFIFMAYLLPQYLALLTFKTIAVLCIGSGTFGLSQIQTRNFLIWVTSGSGSGIIFPDPTLVTQ